MTAVTTAAAGDPTSQEGAGGASSFTDLIDAPASIAPNAVVRGNGEGSALGMSPSISITDADEIFIESAAGGIFIHTTEDGMLELTSTGAGGIQVRSSGSWGTAISAEGTGGLYLSTEATSGELSLAVGSGGLLMGGADVAASDASAHMTVGGTQYSIAKAIKVKIGADTYYWPLFGPA